MYFRAWKGGPFRTHVCTYRHIGTHPFPLRYRWMLERNANYSTSQIYAHSIISLFPEEQKSTMVKKDPPDFKFCLNKCKFSPYGVMLFPRLPEVSIEPTTAYQADAHPTEQPQHSNVIPIQIWPTLQLSTSTCNIISPFYTTVSLYMTK